MPVDKIERLSVHYEINGEGETLILFPDNLHASQAYEEDINYYVERPFMWSDPNSFRYVSNLFLNNIGSGK
jgi:hypothetical protein